MLFPTVDFAVFFIVVFTGSWMLRPYRMVWRWFILLASCVFYVDPFVKEHNPGAAALPALGVFGAFAVVATLAIRAVSTSDEPGGDRREAALGVLGAVAVGFVVVNLVLNGMLPDKNQEFFRFLLLLLGMVLVNQAGSRAVYASMGEGRSRTDLSRWVVRAMVVFDLGVLGVFKYVPWLYDQFTAGEPLGWALPLAISFFTFQAISYIVDVGRGEIRPVPLLDFAVYLTFFAHVVAGPIVRVREFVPQLTERADPRFVPASEAVVLIFRGLFKKVVISSYLASQIVDPVFAVPAGHSRLEVLFAILGYAIQIYADFSGYTDIAIGVALLLGIRFPQNFDAPYRALSLQDFWRRWHMTLSRWLRDYLYIPLGGNRVSVPRTYLNLFLTMLLGGLWHGANWTFVIWGALHGGGLAVERWFRDRRSAAGPAERPAGVGAVAALRWLGTFAFVCFAWVFFRAPSVGDAFAVLGQLVTGSGATGDVSNLVTPLVVLCVAAMVGSQFVPPRFAQRTAEEFARLAPILQILVFGLGLMIIDALAPETLAAFIYFQF